MPRPGMTERGAGSSGGRKSSNPISNWLARRKERRTQMEEQASRMITNDIARNEATIIDQLNSIDWLKSKLPRTALDEKSNEKQPCGDLEFAARVIVRQLQKNPKAIKMDIRKIDQKLLTLVLLYKQAVEYGDIRAAYAAKGALVRGFKDIRSRIPENQPELAKQFVEANTQYLDQWITLVNLAQKADRQKQNLESTREEHAKLKGEFDERIHTFADKLKTDTEYGEVYMSILRHNAPEERAKWTDIQRRVHMDMVEQRLGRVNLDLNGRVLYHRELDLAETESQVDMLHTSVAALEIVADPNLLNKFRESVDNLFTQLAASDAAIDASLQLMDDIEGRIKALDFAAGSQRQKEVVAEEAELVLEEVKKQQEIHAGQSKLKGMKIREELGLLSDEQLAEKRRQAEIEEQRAMEELAQMQAELEAEVLEEEQGQLLYVT